MKHITYISKSCFLKTKNPKPNRSFTLLEVAVAIALIAVGIYATMALAGSSFRVMDRQKNKSIAIGLAKEGMEIIRNIRDENWLYTGNSDCNKNGTITTCTNGQIYDDGANEDHEDCDWRCGNEGETVDFKPTFTLDEGLRDIDYNGDIKTGSGATINCQEKGWPLFIQFCVKEESGVQLICIESHVTDAKMDFDGIGVRVFLNLEKNRTR